MSFTTPWLNEYSSLMKLVQDPNTGLLQGTYSSTTGGVGTYDVVGWAALPDATTGAGQTMAISILWRSNDNGKSDPSHEVSTMVGQVVMTNNGENLALIHLFVETDPATTPELGIYPDKLIFTPYAGQPIATGGHPVTITALELEAMDNLTGIWIGEIRGKTVQITFQPPVPGQTQINGQMIDTNGIACPIVGYTDIFASSASFNWQGITFSTYIDGANGRESIGLAGYINLSTYQMTLNRLIAKSTPANSTWYQTQQVEFQLMKKIIMEGKPAS